MSGGITIDSWTPPQLAGGISASTAFAPASSLLKNRPHFLDRLGARSMVCPDVGARAKALPAPKAQRGEMRGKGHGGIDAVLRTTDSDHARDRILRAHCWLTRTAASA